MDRVFLDANILFYAAYKSKAGVLRLWAMEDVRLLTAESAAIEARRNLDTDEQRGRLDRLLGGVAIPRVAFVRPLPRAVALAAKDRPILRAAIAMKATHLLTGDRKHFGALYSRTVRGVLILPPSDYPPLLDDRGIGGLTRPPRPSPP